LDCNSPLHIDLHIHSDASDGTLSPAEIIDMAQKLNLAAIAITDHDTVDGSKAAVRSGIPPSIRFLSGIEISADPPPSFPCAGSFHILGYRIRVDDPSLNQNLTVLQEARRNRNPQIIERLNSLGMDISSDELKEAFGEEGQLGRPHIARLLMKKKMVASVSEAFDRYLGKGRPAYQDKYRCGCAQAIELIRNAGGIPVLAHPALLKPTRNQPVGALIRILKNMGLSGIEVFYPEHSSEQTALYADLATLYDLLMTGGTDFHGSVKPDIRMGTGRGNFSVPYILYEKLTAAA